MYGKLTLKCRLVPSSIGQDTPVVEQSSLQSKLGSFTRQHLLPSSSGPGYLVLIQETGVRFSLGAQVQFQHLVKKEITVKKKEIFMMFLPNILGTITISVTIINAFDVFPLPKETMFALLMLLSIITLIAFGWYPPEGKKTALFILICWIFIFFIHFSSLILLI